MGFTWQWGSQLESAGNVNFAALTTWLVPLLIAAVAAPMLSGLFLWLEKGGMGKRKRGASQVCGAESRGADQSGGAAFCSAGRGGGAESCGADQRGGTVGRSGRWNRLCAAWDDLPQVCRFLLAALFLFLAWLPVFLAVYPGFFAYDATDELEQVLTGSYVTRHPLLHVLLLGKTVLGVEGLTGSYNAGIAAYVLFQMAAMALLLSWETGCLKKLGAGRALRGVSLCFFAFFPVIPMYVLCTSKDIWYTAGMLAAVTLLCLLVKARKEERTSCDGTEASVRISVHRPPQKQKGMSYWIGLGCALFVMAVFRNNGFYVFLIMILALLWLAGRENRRRAAVTAGVVLLLVLGQNALLKAALHPADTGVQETLTVPIQQLSRTWNYSPEVFSEEDREALFEILPQEVLERYTPKLSDLVKIDFNTENYEKNPARYRKLWLKTGLKAPFTYMNAWLMTSYGFWYPDASIDVYNGWRSYVKSSWFSFETEEPGVRDSHFPWLEEQYRKLSLENIVQQIPVISWLFSPGFLCWAFILAGLFLAASERFKTLLALAPVYLNWLTVLLGPTYLVRYVLIFWFALPLLLCVCRQDVVVFPDQMCYTSMDNAKR